MSPNVSRNKVMANHGSGKRIPQGSQRTYAHYSFAQLFFHKYLIAYAVVKYQAEKCAIYTKQWKCRLDHVA